MKIQSTTIGEPEHNTPREILPRQFLICLERTVPGLNMFEQYFLAPDINTSGNPEFWHDPLFKHMTGAWTTNKTEALHFERSEFALTTAQALMENYSNEAYFSEAAKTLRKYSIGGEQFCLTVVMAETRIVPLYQINRSL